MSWLYRAATDLRNALYDRKLLQSARFEIPTICIGNLNVGGTGKSPHTEYLIELLQYVYQVATLSRGYGRKSHGFVLADDTASARTLGDEPMLFKVKYPDTTVAVAEERLTGIPRLLQENPSIDIILLDDAYQHRAVRAGLSILLTEYDSPFTRDALLPLGWLRESPRHYHRADIIIVTKCPPALSGMEKLKLKGEINPYPYQHVYFSTIEYGNWYPLFKENLMQISRNPHLLLITGIAKNEQIVKYLTDKAENVVVSSYRDHHYFDVYDLENIRETYKNINADNKVIITTEKDAVRLWQYKAWFLENNIPIFVQPIRVRFIDNDGELFNTDIHRYVAITKGKTQSSDG